MMMKVKDTGFSWELFDTIPIVGILRRLPFETLVNVVEQYETSGFTTLEITVDSADFVVSMRCLSSRYRHKLNIGAGTVCCLADLEIALEAGAEFIVTPNVDEQVIGRCKDKGIPIIVGAFTPTEIYKAWSCGASLIKLFPSGGLGPGYLKDLKSGPMSQIDFLPTGGVSLENMTDYFAVGASGMGMGSLLFNHQLIYDRKWKELGTHLVQVRTRVQEIVGALVLDSGKPC